MLAHAHAHTRTVRSPPDPPSPPPDHTSPLLSRAGDLSSFYKEAKKRFDAEPDFKRRAHENVVALQAGDPVNVAYWRRMVRVSEAMFRQVYARLSVDPRLELCGESFYNDKIPAGEAAPRARTRERSLFFRLALCRHLRALSPKHHTPRPPRHVRLLTAARLRHAPPSFACPPPSLPQ